MDSTETDSSAPKQANPAADAHAPRQAAPVMDVTPPPTTDKPADVAPAPETPEAILATPPPDTDKDTTQTKAVSDEVAKEKKSAPKQDKPSKAPGDGTANIIIATVAVLGVLAALAVFAYTQSH